MPSFFNCRHPGKRVSVYPGSIPVEGLPAWIPDKCCALSGMTVVLVCLLLTACASAGNGSYMSYLQQKGLSPPVPDNIPHCRGYGCKYIDHAALTAADWAEISRAFAGVTDAESERAALKPALALFEQKVGRLTGTEEDRGGTYVKLGARQHDCVDESVNTTVYLSLLEQKGLLRFHDIALPASRLPLLTGRLGPHQTAVVADRETGERYAVDTWFHDNGAPAEVAPMDEWFFGWRPE